MSTESDNQRAHREAVAVAHGKFQAAMATATTETQRKNALIQRHKDILASARTNNVRTGSHEALHNLGVSPEGDSAPAGDA